MKTRLINATLIDAHQNNSGSLIIEDGKIVEIAIGFNISDKECDHTLDIDGLALMPAFIDMHAHFRTPGYEYKEDFKTGFAAALKGGFGTVCAMANTNPIIDNVSLLQNNLSIANAMQKVNYIQISAIGKELSDSKFVDIASLRKNTKLFSNDGNTITSLNFMKEALSKSLEFDFILCTHCQPEIQIIERDLKFFSEQKGNLHICHVSKKESIDLIINAKKAGFSFTCEVTPHHLFEANTQYKVNPSVGNEKDRQALIEAVRKNTIDILATDHAPHSPKDKENGSPGIDNIEVAFQMYWQVFSENDISINRLSEMISFKPALRLGLKKGLIKENYDADLVIVDLEQRGKIDKNTFLSKSNNTPYHGKKVKGKVIKTIVNGEIRYDSTKTI